MQKKKKKEEAEESKKAQFLMKLREGSKTINTQPVHAQQNLTGRCTGLEGLVKGRVIDCKNSASEKQEWGINLRLKHESRRSTDEAAYTGTN